MFEIIERVHVEPRTLDVGVFNERFKSGVLGIIDYENLPIDALRYFERQSANYRHPEVYGSGGIFTSYQE